MIPRHEMLARDEVVQLRSLQVSDLQVARRAHRLRK